MADNHLMRVRQGDTYMLTLNYKDENGVAVNLTGYTFEWKVAVGASVNTYTGSPEVISTTPTSGSVQLTLSAAETAAFLTSTGRHWFRITSPGGIKATLLEGYVEVEFNE